MPVAAGLVTEDEVYGQPYEGRESMLSTPAGWATMWAILASVYLVGIYFGMIKIKGHA